MNDNGAETSNRCVHLFVSYLMTSTQLGISYVLTEDFHCFTFVELILEQDAHWDNLCLLDWMKWLLRWNMTLQVC